MEGKHKKIMNINEAMEKSKTILPSLDTGCGNKWVSSLKQLKEAKAGNVLQLKHGEWGGTSVVVTKIHEDIIHWKEPFKNVIGCSTINEGNTATVGSYECIKDFEVNGMVFVEVGDHVDYVELDKLLYVIDGDQAGREIPNVNKKMFDEHFKKTMNESSDGDMGNLWGKRDNEWVQINKNPFTEAEAKELENSLSRDKMYSDFDFRGINTNEAKTVDVSGLDFMGVVTRDEKGQYDTNQMNDVGVKGGEWIELPAISDMIAQVSTNNTEAKKELKNAPKELDIFLTYGLAYWDNNKKDFAVVVMDSKDNETLVYWDNGNGNEIADKVLNESKTNESNDLEKFVNGYDVEIHKIQDKTLDKTLGKEFERYNLVFKNADDLEKFKSEMGDNKNFVITDAPGSITLNVDIISESKTNEGKISLNDYRNMSQNDQANYLAGVLTKIIGEEVVDDDVDGKKFNYVVPSVDDNKLGDVALKLNKAGFNADAFDGYISVDPTNGLPEDLFEESQINERDYDEATRTEFANKGWALPDGSFPIADEEDFNNAIKLAAKANDVDAAKTHIKKRAKELGLDDKIPKTWESKIDEGFENIARVNDVSDPFALKNLIKDYISVTYGRTDSFIDDELGDIEFDLDSGTVSKDSEAMETLASILRTNTQDLANNLTEVVANSDLID